MNYYIIVFSCLFAFVASKLLLRSVGGRNASDGEFPFILSLEVKSKHRSRFFCSGSALTPTWALTAGHCFNRIFMVMKRNLTCRVRYNSLITGVMGKTSDIISVVKHAQNDIGLLNTLPMNVHGFAKLSSLDYTSLYGKQAFAVGYGSTNVTYNYEKRDLNTLQVVEGMLTRCVLRQEMNKELCLLPRCNAVASMAPGDSGGPVVHSSGVVAICVGGTSVYDKSRHFLPTPSNGELKTVICSLEAVSLFLDWVRNVVAT